MRSPIAGDNSEKIEFSKNICLSLSTRRIHSLNLMWQKERRFDKFSLWLGSASDEFVCVLSFTLSVNREINSDSKKFFIAVSSRLFLHFPHLTFLSLLVAFPPTFLLFSRSPFASMRWGKTRFKIRRKCLVSRRSFLVFHPREKTNPSNERDFSLCTLCRRDVCGS